MKLKGFNIVISSKDQFALGVKHVLKHHKSRLENNHSLEFDSFETFKRVLTINKLQILIAISRLRPASINQLAKLIDREYPHVLKDCNALESYGFISLEEMGKARKQRTPKLVFDYDFIRIKSKFEEILPISERSNKILLSESVI